jgi:glycine betaine/proline transport system substrate-binding protein
VPAWQGICATPAAAEKGLKTIADLSDPEKTKLLDTDGDGKGEMWIGAQTWSSTGIERVRANSYGYAKNLTLVEAEEEVAMAGIDAAVATDQPDGLCLLRTAFRLRSAQDRAHRRAGT